jgi:zinc transport system permease protein
MFEIFQNTFMVRAMLAGAMVAVIAPFIGIFLTIRRYPYLSDTLSHVSLVGVAFATLLRIQPIIGAIAVTIVAAWVIEYLRYKKRLGGESVLSIFLSGSLAVALIIMSLAKSFNVNFLGFLFGSITTITPHELLYIALMGLVVLVGIMIFFKKFFWSLLAKNWRKWKAWACEQLICCS